MSEGETRTFDRKDNLHPLPRFETLSVALH